MSTALPLPRRSSDLGGPAPGSAAPAGGTVAVAVSGGRDSLALLHCTLRAARPLGIDVLALHVHHGLQGAADGWAEHVATTCNRWRARGWPLRLVMQRLAGRPAAGDSVEAWARRERYLALAAMARGAGATLVLLAHHRGDQAETFLLQALRGAGPAGLAAMPPSAVREGITWARPWLHMAPAAIASYARRHRLRYIEDPSNTDPRFDRSRLRAQVMPALRQAFAQADVQLLEAAARSAEAQAVLDEVAQQDLAAIDDAGTLRLAPWRLLSPARRRNALRAWLRQRSSGRGAPQSLIERLMGELPAAGAARWLWGDLILRRYRGRLDAVPTAQGDAPDLRLPRPAAIGGAGLHRVAGQGGALLAVAVEQGGVSLAALSQAQWRARCGGERFQRAPGTPPRSLKKQYQAAGVPAWQRDAPLLFDAAGRLLFVPGLGLDARALASHGEPQLALLWQRKT
jgi:tRNA(Ile)-lysidine synthase